jgi:predicted NBD/HSP70 family sugar kinase
MYLAIDIGGTKTLLAVFDEHGKIAEQYKFPTDKNYAEFLKDLSQALDGNLKTERFKAIACAVPGQLDKTGEIVLRFGNLDWENIRVKHDLEALIPHTAVLVQNDAKLAGLSEALEHPRYHKVLYLTVSTGIGAGLMIDGKIDPYLADSEPGQMVLEFRGKIRKWEDFASGRALVKRYGKRASEIEEPKIWREFSAGLARGMNELIATLQPDAIILGGGVGAHYEKFSKYLEIELAKLANDMVATPPIIKARRAEEAVVYGCYAYIRQKL